MIHAKNAWWQLSILHRRQFCVGRQHLPQPHENADDLHTRLRRQFAVQNISAPCRVKTPDKLLNCF